MLWIKVKVGGSVQIGEELLTLLAKDRNSLTIDLNGKEYRLNRTHSYKFKNFTLVTGMPERELRFGIDAPNHIPIRRRP